MNWSAMRLPDQRRSVRSRSSRSSDISADNMSAAVSTLQDGARRPSSASHCARRRLAGVLAGVGLIGEFVLFTISGNQPTTLQHASTALQFLQEHGITIRAAALMCGLLNRRVRAHENHAGRKIRIIPGRGRLPILAERLTRTQATHAIVVAEATTA